MRDTLSNSLAIWLRRTIAFLLVSPYSTPIAAGVLLRLLLMPFAIQLDIVVHTWIASFVAQGRIDVYQYYYQRFGTSFFPPGTQNVPAAGFPPLFYLIDGLYLATLQALHVFNFSSVDTRKSVFRCKYE